MKSPRITKIFTHRLSFSLLLFTLLPLSHSTDLFCNDDDKAVLLQIKSHFPGVGLLSDWDPTTDCCDWSFIGCTSEYDAHPGRVNGVTISAGSGLSGEIPAVIGNLPYLEEIMFVDERKLTGPIPESFSKLKYLQIIYLSSNSLTGRIPDFLGGLKNLQQIDISDNRFTGSIPPSLSLLPQLAQFNVSRNLLTGSVPDPPPKLKSFDISHNMMTGTLPSKLGKLKMDFVDVSYNQLCGPIPAGLNRFGPSRFGHNKCLCGPPLPACKATSYWGGATVVF